MGELGTYAIALALVAALWSVVASLIGALRHRTDMVRSAEGAVLATALAVTVAAVTLLTALVTSDFSLAYVAEYTNRSLATPYKMAAMWAGQGGSLLLWTWLSALLAAMVVVQNRRKGWGIAPYAVTTFGVVTGLFAALVTLIESPFTAIAGPVADGQGLNPLLQNPLQIIHPLALYGGYILYTVPFALTISALAEGPAQGAWVKVAQRWSALSWIALTIGIVLGARWAYAELGWGGYWGWDPVENASLLPWLTGTALLHSGLTHWRSGRLRLLGFVMVVTTFVLCLFGTFLTRSGVISSVHAFGESGLGPVMGGAIFAILLVSGGLIVWRLPQLRAPRADGRGHGWVGQRSLSVLLVAITVAVLWGTMYPLFLRVLRDQEIAVTPEFFRVVVTPLGVAVLAVFALSPLLPDQTVGDRRRTAAMRAVAAVVLFAGFWLLSSRQNPGVALVLTLCVLALATVIRKATPRLTSAWQATTDGRVLATLRASGPYVGHVGLVVLLAAVTLNASLQQDGRATLKVGEVATAGGQTVRLTTLTADPGADRTSFIARLDVLDADGQTTATVDTRQEQFTADGNTHAEVGILTGLRSDIYVVLEEADISTQVATITVFTNPGVIWIWVGGALLALGGVLFALPRRRGAPAMAMETTVSERDDQLVEV
jgi:cytochrome c-type biogenesis protein CcmF